LPKVIQEQAIDIMLGTDNCFLTGAGGVGKAQPLTSKILTPSGWTTMGELSVGSKVVGRDGKPHNVTGIFPKGKLPVFRVKTKDGGTTICCEDHLWAVKDINDRRRKRDYKVLPLSYIRRKLNGRKDRKEINYVIPTVEPVCFPHRDDLPIDPYILGILLGDGSFRAKGEVRFTSADSEIVERVKLNLQESHRVNSNGIEHTIVGNNGKNEILEGVSLLNLDGLYSHQKFIPPEYLISSKDQRYELLRGIMDADGTNPKGKRTPYLSTSSYKLRDDVVELVRSLGGVTSVREKMVGEHFKDSYQISMRLAYTPFNLTRKIETWHPGRKQDHRFIESVTFVGEQECQCISVDAEDHLYVTDDYIVTHNTWVINQVMRQLADEEIEYALTASTGIAAQLIGGQTIHSFAGLGIKDNVRDIVGSNYWRRKIGPMLKRLEVLIIDEVSMLGARTFELLDEVMQIACGNDKPFGGCRVIIVGDPFQLPPVNDDYFFISETYWNSKFRILNLTKNYRTTNDDWTNLLRKIRIGVIDDDVLEMFYRRSGRKAPHNCTRIVSTNFEADKINNGKLTTLSGRTHKFFYSVDDPHGILGPKGEREYKRTVNEFFKNRLIKSDLELKVGAWVMIVVNDNQEFQYVNGTTGEVIHIVKDSIVVETKKELLDESGQVVLGDDKMPVMVADKQIEISAKHPFKVEKTIRNPKFGGTYKDETGREVFDDRDTITAEAVIYTLPVILAWAITTHKSQGQTLDMARIDLRRGFTDGQAYVALSRVRSEEGVYLDGIPSDASLDVNQDVVDFVQFNIDEFSQPLRESVIDVLNAGVAPEELDE
jgi:hypothetical protein